MNYDDVMRWWGTQVAASDAIGVSQSAISRWRTHHGKVIPAFWQLRIEMLTHRALLADADVLEPRRRPKSRRRPKKEAPESVQTIAESAPAESAS